MKYFPKGKGYRKEGKKKRHHTHISKDYEPVKKKIKEDSSSDAEYVLISALIGTVTFGSNVWLIDSDASKHMIGFKNHLSHMIEEDSPYKVILGYEYQYPKNGQEKHSTI